MEVNYRYIAQLLRDILDYLGFDLFHVVNIIIIYIKCNKHYFHVVRSGTFYIMQIQYKLYLEIVILISIIVLNTILI